MFNEESQQPPDSEILRAVRLRPPELPDVAPGQTIGDRALEHVRVVEVLQPPDRREAWTFVLRCEDRGVVERPELRELLTEVRGVDARPVLGHLLERASVDDFGHGVVAAHRCSRVTADAVVPELAVGRGELVDRQRTHRVGHELHLGALAHEPTALPTARLEALLQVHLGEHVETRSDERFLGSRGVLLVELDDVAVALVEDRPPAPRESIVPLRGSQLERSITDLQTCIEELEERLLLFVVVVELEVRQLHVRRAVLVVHPPREEERAVLRLTAHRLQPHLVEVVPSTVRSGLEHHDCEADVGHCLHQTSGDGLRVVPERHLGAVQEAHRLGSAGVLVARGRRADMRLRFVPLQHVLRLVLRGEERPERVGVPIGLRHAEQVLRVVLLVGDDETGRVVQHE